MGSFEAFYPSPAAYFSRIQPLLLPPRSKHGDGPRTMQCHAAGVVYGSAQPISVAKANRAAMLICDSRPFAY